MVAVSPNAPEQNSDLAKQLGSRFRILSDPDLAITETFGIRHVGAAAGIDRPHPTTFVADAAGTLSASFENETYRVRPDPSAVLQALRDAARPQAPFAIVLHRRRSRVIVVSGTFEIDPAQRERALEVAGAMAAVSLAESGCAAYGFWADPADGNRFRVFEEWESAAALDAHFQTPHMATFIAELRTLGVSSAEVWRYEATEKSRLM